MKMKCTKCGIREIDSKYMVDRDTGYCKECAELLHLGTSREAQKIDQGIPRTTDADEDDKGELLEEDETV